MTDSPDSPESPEIEEVRRLLAEARHTEPMPDDVVARMDDVIEGLRETPAAASAATDEPAEPTRYDNVVPMVRRRRRVAGMLVAAAAIVVGGVALAQNLPLDSTASSSSTADSGADSALGNTGNSEDPSGRSKGPKSQRLEDGVTSRKPVLKGGRLLVHPQSFSLDALAGRKLLKGRLATATSSQAPGPLDRCASVPTGNGTLIRATYQDAPAALVYRRASGGSQVVDLYVCGTAKPVRSATLPAP